MKVAVASKRSKLVSLFLTATLALAAWPACSKKQAEPSAAKPAATSAASAQPSAKPAPIAVAKCEPEADGKCKPSPSCAPNCDLIATPECLECEAAGDCASFAGNCESSLLSAEERATCYEILSCLQKTNCFDGLSTTLGSCYCGTLPLKECLAAPMSGPGAPNGACRDVILKGMPKATKQPHVLGNLTMRVNAAGLALSRLNCQKIGYRKLCANACGFGPIKPDPLPRSTPDLTTH